MMKKQSFELAPKVFFGFFPVTEPETSHIGPLAHRLGHEFSAVTQSQQYGMGVKSITATLILTDPEGLGRAHKVKQPKYSAGVRTIKAHGVTVSTEDTLEFGLKLVFDDVRNATTESQVAAAILPAIAQVRPALRKLKIPEFDMDRFLSDLEDFFENARVRGAYAH